MIRQTVLPFKPEKNKRPDYSHAGPALSGELAMGLGLLKKPDRHPPKPGSGAGYAPGKHLFPLMLMQNGGGGSPEDLRPIRKDTGLRELLRRQCQLDRVTGIRRQRVRGLPVVRVCSSLKAAEINILRAALVVKATRNQRKPSLVQSGKPFRFFKERIWAHLPKCNRFYTMRLQYAGVYCKSAE